MIPDELPIFLISTIPIGWPRGSGAIFAWSFMGKTPLYRSYNTDYGPFNKCFTSLHRPAFSRRTAPEVCKSAPPQKKRAQGRPGARCTRDLMCNVHQKIRT